MPPTAPPNNAGANTYLRTKVFTAAPEELRLMLIDGCIKFARQGREGLASRDFEASYTGFSKCRAILLELMTSMRPEHDPDLCARLTSLYTFLFNHLVAGAHEKDLTKIDKVIDLLEYERQTWTMLIAKMAADRTPGTSPGAPGSCGPVSPSDAFPALSVHG